ncbi:hypothetical protein JTE90_004734 [Oedothorax gibbosus]|uniref:Uncharacterized protein n=1 Tax=Oedothorax gibbosus TaxID=931172 RepID=A0AAV6TWV8_9ARAC|nr:hypothetical protein JTE90_004734 [Oedothorax gibbosus]
MMRRGGFCLRKWKSSDPSIFKDLPHDSQESDLVHLDDSDCSVLGVKWSPKSDDFKFAVPSIDMKDNYTKREVLSQIARAFDPLGLLSPSVIFMKIVLQELWQANLSWDQPLPEELSSKWRSFLSEIVLLQQVTFPRYVLLPKALVEIHAFCDASEKAYCAVLYARSISSDSIRTVLLTSKTRVAPLKVQSLPRLELCSALLLSNLLSSTVPHLDISISAVFAWSDSQITLAWINSEPSRWKPFVANRVSQIQELVPEAQWNFVRGLENPADCGTRGLTPSEFVTCDLWFNGPRWLSTNSTLPLNKVEENQQIKKEMSSEEKKQAKITLVALPMRHTPVTFFH